MMLKPNGFFQEEPISFDYPKSQSEGVALPKLDVPDISEQEALPNSALRQDQLKDLPQLSEFEMLRHFTRLSKRNLSIDSGMYPLGSCTMKYNPRLNELVARYEGFTQSHPHMPTEMVQGNLQLLHELEELLLEVTGFDAVSLQPAAGAQGELCGIMIIRACLEARGEHRKYVLVPDSAHGTNPSTAVMSGYAVKQLKSTETGLVDLESLKEAMTEDVAALMLTNPNTLGLFETDILEIAKVVHDKGGFIYCDGANMNAQLGITRPADYGMDVMHMNLHKTFSTPHGGGGPGAGPCFCVKELEPYLPVPRVKKQGDRYEWDWDRPHSIGKLTTFYGNFGVLIRALAYGLALGAEGIREAGEIAVLNANYIRHHLEGVLDASSQNETLHEVVFSDKTLKPYGITTLDFAKRLMDYGFHPPTTYFPLTVPGALMIEPTESEPKAELDKFIQVVHQILEEAKENPELVKTAPHLAPRKRLDETRAARQPILRWVPEPEAQDA